MLLLLMRLYSKSFTFFFLVRVLRDHTFFKKKTSISVTIWNVVGFEMFNECHRVALKIKCFAYLIICNMT